MVQRRRPACRISRSRNTTATARSSSGWSGSATNNTSNKPAFWRKEFAVNLSFENQVALVTGAASGMGLATAKAFAEAGAAVALADVNEAAVHTAADDLVAAHHKAIGI